MLGRGGNRRGRGPALTHWRGTCQRPARPCRQDFDCRDDSASGRGADFGVANVSGLLLSHGLPHHPVFSRPVLSRPVAGHFVVVRCPYDDADRDADTLGFPDRHADTDTNTVVFPDWHAVVFPHRDALAQAIQVTQAHPQAIAHPDRAPECPAVADRVRHLGLA
jgi:hypothetical protein